MVSLVFKFGIFCITGKIEFNSDWRISGDIHRQAMLGDDDSLGQEAAEKVAEDLKFRVELALLNATLKKLDADWDFTVLTNPLLADQGPAIAVVPKREFISACITCYSPLSIGMQAHCRAFMCTSFQLF